ncbi:MAG: protein translocase subunit SecF [Desulfobacterales bacterium]
MQFIKPGINIDIIGKRRIAFVVSAIVLLISIGSLIYHKGLKQGVDFAGGTLIQVKFSSPVNVGDIKSGLNFAEIGKPSVQQFGESGDNEYLIHTDASGMTGHGFSQSIVDGLQSATGTDVELRRIEMVGPQVGKDLREKALFALFYALLFITIYISGRFEMKWLISGVMAGALSLAVYFLSAFNVSIPILIVAALIISIVLFWFLQLKYAMGAIVALIHDVIITVGIFSLADKEFTLPIVAALLTIIGYSLNDTIIVFDRIRENLRKYHKDTLEVIINRSINETLSRTILTSITTLFVVVTLFVLGGGIIHDLAFALMVGVIVGTYSSVFVASPILLIFHAKK